MNQFQSMYKEILTPSEALGEKDFIHSAYSYGDIFELAAGIQQSIVPPKRWKRLSAFARKTKLSLPPVCWLRLPVPAG